MQLKVFVTILAMSLVAACCSTKEYSPTTKLSEVPKPGTVEEFVTTVGDRVYFAFDTSGLSDDSKEILRRQADWLKRYGDRRVVIEGHCDERGDRLYNLALGARRAHAARDFLVSQGIPSSRLSTISYGKERPFALGSTEEAWRQNRVARSVIQTP